MPLRAIFTRHGESTANVNGVFANRPGIPGDLTPLGRAQAQELPDRLAAMGATHLYTSPLPRAVQTAQIVSEALGLPFTITDALREYDVGDFEGFPYTGDHAWRLDAYWQIDRGWASGNLGARLAGGESLRDLLDRFLPFMDTLPEQHGDDDMLVLIGHGGLWRAVLLHLFHPAPDAIRAREPMHHGDMVLARYGSRRWHFDGRNVAKER